MICANLAVAVYAPQDHDKKGNRFVSTRSLRDFSRSTTSYTSRLPCQTHRTNNTTHHLCAQATVEGNETHKENLSVTQANTTRSVGERKKRMRSRKKKTRGMTRMTKRRRMVEVRTARSLRSKSF